MSAVAEVSLDVTLENALRAREAAARAQEFERVCVVRFADEARRLGWTWERIGGVLGTSDVAARRFYQRNRRPRP